MYNGSHCADEFVLILMTCVYCGWFSDSNHIPVFFVRTALILGQFLRVGSRIIVTVCEGPRNVFCLVL